MLKMSGRSIRGSFTIEASIVFAFLLSILVVFVFSCLLIVQMVIVQKAASVSAAVSSELVRNRAIMDLECGEGLYQRLSNENGSIRGEIFFGRSMEEASRDMKADRLLTKKLLLIEQVIRSQLQSQVILPDSCCYEVSYDNSLMQDRISIEVTQRIAVPVGFIKEWFDGSTFITIKGTAFSYVSEPAEYIRNIDLIVEYSSRLKDEIDLKGIFEKLKDKKD